MTSNYFSKEMASVLLSDSQTTTPPKTTYFSEALISSSFFIYFSHGIGKAVVTLLLSVYYCRSLAYSKKRKKKICRSTIPKETRTRTL